MFCWDRRNVSRAIPGPPPLPLLVVPVVNDIPCSKMEDRTWPVAVVLLLVGIVGDAANIKVGLEASKWLLLGIAALVAAVFFRIGRAIYWNKNPPK